MRPPAELDLPWTRSRPASRLREFIVCCVLGPLMDLYTRRRLAGRERLDGLDGPVVFVANHSSHMDTPVILRALPGHRRRRTAVAAATDYFFTNRRNAVSSSLVFGTVPVDREGGGLDATAHLGDLLSGGGSLLMYAEGTRSGDAKVGRLRSGAAVLAARHRAPIVPVYVGGTSEAMPKGHHWMVFKAGRPGPRHQIDVRFGAPLRPGEDPSEAMERIRLFLAESGADTEGPRPVERQPA